MHWESIPSIILLVNCCFNVKINKGLTSLSRIVCNVIEYKLIIILYCPIILL